MNTTFIKVHTMDMIKIAAYVYSHNIGNHYNIS
jgi:hypothetical protein